MIIVAALCSSCQFAGHPNTARSFLDPAVVHRAELIEHMLTSLRRRNTLKCIEIHREPNDVSLWSHLSAEDSAYLKVAWRFSLNGPLLLCKTTHEASFSHLLLWPETLEVK